MDTAGNLYTTDGATKKAYEIFTEGTIKTLGNDFTFNSPYSMVVDISGNAYVADTFGI